MDTKFGKYIDTFFAQGFEEAETALADWMRYLDEVALYCPDDPLFPSTRVVAKSNTGFQAENFHRRCWKTLQPVGRIVRLAFETAGVPNFGPHAFRHMLIRHVVNSGSSIAEFVANSQNLGHKDVLTIIRSYGQISRERQRELITGLDDDGDDHD